ncbi:MAG TPA: cytochrome P450 [Ktedonobacteraceae bacterium]|nr:cytochrome P450 [Ktedonobacteraceae bacterium]
MEVQPEALQVPGFQPQSMRAPFYNAERNSWQVFRYDDVKRILSDYHAFSSQREALDPQQSSELNAGQRSAPTMISLDPPEHRVYRDLAGKTFTPRRIEEQEPFIRETVEQLLAKVAGQGTMDMIDDFAYLLPITVIARMLGVPNADQPQFKQWTDDFFEFVTPAAARAQKELALYFQGLFEERRREPQDDFISALLTTEVEGKTFTNRDLIGLCSLLLLAGNDTTRHLIGNALLCFDAYPENMEQLRTQPDLISNAVEEVLRYLPSISSPARVATSGIVIEGQTIQAGQWILPMVASANRDEAHFPNAEIFDIRRTPNRHLTFGFGVHFCLGAPLARLESKIALEMLLAHFTDIKRVRSIPLEAAVSPQLYGVKHLPITFTRI